METTGIGRKPRHVFIIGSKSIGQYGGYETFVQRLVAEHEHNPAIQYHVACKANGEGYMDESKLEGVEVTKRTHDGAVEEFTYKGAHVFKIACPNIGPAVALYYDRAALRYSIRYCQKHNIQQPVFYVLTCRIGPVMGGFARIIHRMGGEYHVNPDGHEWMRAKWSAPVRKYWKMSEQLMIRSADLVICDSLGIQDYVRKEYERYAPRTTYIAYGADLEPSSMPDDDPTFAKWTGAHGVRPGEYYLVVGRFVPENNYETMIREFMQSSSNKDFVLVTNANEAFLAQLEERLHFGADPRIKFVGTVYDRELLNKIRERAYAYLHGHEVGGTNPSLLEALGSTELNLLLDVNFNREVARDAALYWSKEQGSLAGLLREADSMDADARAQLGKAAKQRIASAYSWELIGNEYLRVWG